MSDRKLHFECRQCEFIMTATDLADYQIRKEELLSVVKYVVTLTPLFMRGVRPPHSLTRVYL